MVAGFCPDASTSRLKFVALPNAFAPEHMRRLYTSPNAMATTASFNTTVLSKPKGRWQAAKIVSEGHCWITRPERAAPRRTLFATHGL